MHHNIITKFLDEISSGIAVSESNKPAITARVSDKRVKFREILESLNSYKKEVRSEVPNLLHAEFRGVMNQQLGAFGMRARGSSITDAKKFKFDSKTNVLPVAKSVDISVLQKEADKCTGVR